MRNIDDRTREPDAMPLPVRHPIASPYARLLLRLSTALIVALAVPASALADAKPPQPERRAAATGVSAVAMLPPRPTPRPAEAAGRLAPGDAAWRTTLAFAEAGNWDDALAVRGRSRDPHLSAVLTWLSLLDERRKTDFATVAAFLTDHPGWPGQTQIETLAETLMPAHLPATIRVTWFDAHPPRTGNARLSYLDGLERVGPTEKFIAAVRQAWNEGEFGEKSQREFLERYRRHLTADDHWNRLDRLLWRGQADAATRMLPLVSEDRRRLADARIRLRHGRPGVDGAVNAVPRSLRDDPGLHYERLRWRRDRGLADEARELLLQAPSVAEYEDLWWRERGWHIREAMNAGKPGDAYLMAASHTQRRGVAFAEAEWLAGWIALRFLDRPEDALRHFSALYDNVSTPISLGRAAYWAGRAADAAGDPDGARRWYGRGAEQSTTFYGQLASARLGSRAITLAVAGPPDPQKVDALRSSELMRVTEALIRVDRRKLAERFLRTLAFRTTDEDELLVIARLAAQHGYTPTAVYATRRAARAGTAVIEIGYPLLDAKPEYPPEPALVHAIIRQESGFDSEAVSRAGARGLMQLMPATAQQTARGLGLGYDLGALLSDPAYNVALGRAYLAAMIDRFGGHYILAIAAYNAGPGRVDQWIARHGHPANPDVDVIDWIERIPFAETRNYVHRVLEGLQVYRDRLASSSTVPGSNRPPQAVWCVYACGVLVDDHRSVVATDERR